MQAKNSADYSVASVPEMARYITVGFNSTMHCLQNLARPASVITPATGAEGAEGAEDAQENKEPVEDMAAIFVSKSTLPALLTSSAPTLVAAASARHPSRPPIRLVSLPAEAEKRLAEVLVQPRVGFVGLLHDAPGGKALIDMAMKTPPVDVPWLRTDAREEYRPVSIKITCSVLDRGETSQLD